MTMNDTTSFQQQLRRVASIQFTRPNLDLIANHEERQRYLTQCVPLYKAAMRSDWKKAKKLLDQNSLLISSAITKGWATVLHIAVTANRVHFVKELVKLMDRDDLELKDYNGNTAFCFAAGFGNVVIAEILLEKNGSLATIRGGAETTPLFLAVLQGKRNMAHYLFPKTIGILQEKEWDTIFHVCINSGLYDLALKMLDQKERLAFTRGDNNETGLHIMVRKHSDCGRQRRWHLKHLLNLCVKDVAIHMLMQRMWNIFLTLEDSEMMQIIREPTQLVCIAAEVGNVEFLSMVLSSYPDMIWEVNELGQSLVHIALMKRHASIFNLINEMSYMKHILLGNVDDVGNNLLHCVGKLPLADGLDIVYGDGLQMVLELSWFEEVKNLVPPSIIDMKNAEGITPRELFTKEHEELRIKGELWMKSTANSCMVVSTLIATGVFTAAFSLPGGNNDNIKSPNYLEKPIFTVFALSDSMALVSSSSSILIFLSILISRYSEDDFLMSLPLKLISGLVTLFVSIISMMVAFSSAFFITYYHGLKWVPFFISILACLPIPLFICLQFSLWSDIVYSAYIWSSLFRPRKHMIR